MARTTATAGKAGPGAQLGVQAGEGEGDGGTVAVGVGLGCPVTIAKSTSEMSKKIFPIASIFTRAVWVGVLGIRMLSDPSLGVLAERTVGKVVPPSVEREILTFAAFTGAPFVPATFQVTVKFVFT